MECPQKRNSKADFQVGSKGVICFFVRDEKQIFVPHINKMNFTDQSF